MKRVKIYIILCAVLLLLGCQKQRTAEEYLDLGQKYLADLNYEAAIIEFTKAIELDDKYIEAYEWRAQGYEAWAEALADSDPEKSQEKYQLAIIDYETILSLDPAHERAERQLLELYEKRDDTDGLEEPLDEEPSGEMNISGSVLDLMGQICDACESENFEQVFELMKGDEYQDLQKTLLELERPIYNEETGKYLAIYSVAEKKYGNHMIYYGDYQEGKRHGNGLWIGCNGENSYYASGQWADDKPNGPQDEISISNEGMDRMTGTAENGLWNGEVSWVHSRMHSGMHRVEEYSVSFDHGKWVVLYVEEIQGQNEYYIADNGNSAISRSNVDKTEGIVGF